MRRSILKALQGVLGRFTGVVADIGAGISPYKELVTSTGRVDNYIGLDLADNPYQSPDLIWDALNIPMASRSVNGVLATEVLEHCPDPANVLSEAYRILADDGFLFLTAPFLWPLHDVPNDQYRYTPWSLERMLKEAGFVDVEVKPLGGYDASLAQMIGLYVKRRSRAKTYKKTIGLVLAFLAVPLVWALTRMDNPPEAFREGLMITGLRATARKRSRPTGDRQEIERKKAATQ